MIHMTAENVSLVFPLYARAQRAAAPDNPEDMPSPHDERIILSANGRILGVKAVQDISFSVTGGERLALIGRNGSGKTTLLQLLAGIFTPDTGRISVCGRPTNLININLGARHDASGRRNITLRGLAAGHSLAEIEARRKEIEAFSELGEFLDMPVETYSAGMRMRLNFAIATAFEPEILILDEWIGAGDAAFRRKATRRMRDFVDRAGILVLASHSRAMLIENCERAIWLERGRIRADGPVREIIEAYEADAAKEQASTPAKTLGPRPGRG